MLVNFNSSKCLYHESYDIKRDFRCFKFYNLVQSKKQPTYFRVYSVFHRGDRRKSFAKIEGVGGV